MSAAEQMRRTRVRGALWPALVGLARLVRGARDRRGEAGRPSWTDHRGSATDTEMRALVTTPRDERADPEVICETDQRLLAARLLVGLSDRRALLVVSPRSGSRTLDAARRAATAARTPTGRAPGTRPLVDVHFCSSGSTGAARLVRTRRGPGAAWQALGALGRLPHLRRPVVACLAPLDHGHGFSLFLLTRLLGGRFIALDADSAVTQLANEARVDLLSGVPLQLRELCDKVERDGVRVRVGNVLSGSDALDPRLAERIGRVFGAPVGNAYGSTETGTVCLATPADRRRDPATVGRPLPGCTITTRDGLLVVTSPMLAGDAFTGDRGWIGSDGLVRVTGRADGVLVSGGENVQPDAVASWLRTRPGVADVTCGWVPDDRFGERAAFRVAARPGATLVADELRAEIGRVFGMASVPVTIEIVAHTD